MAGFTRCQLTDIEVFEKMINLEEQMIELAKDIKTDWRIMDSYNATKDLPKHAVTIKSGSEQISPEPVFQLTKTKAYLSLEEIELSSASIEQLYRNYSGF